MTEGLPVALSCQACGSHDLGGICRNCDESVDELTEHLAELYEQLETAKRMLVREGSKVRRLQGEADRKLKANKQYPAALRVLKQWQQHCHPNAREINGGERVRCVIARLNGGYTEEELQQCILGYARFAYVVNRRRTTQGSPATRRIDAELVFGDPGHVDQGIAYAAEVARREQAMEKMAAAAIPTSNAKPPISNASRLSPLGEAALRLAELGFYVFPVAPRGKVPVTTNGLKDATLDAERITRFWTQHPDHNIGLRCGIESGIAVLDQDGEEGIASLRALESKYTELPPTGSVVTPRGGQHYYFIHPDAGEIRNTSGFPGPGLDIRGDGGYVLAVPSVGSNGRRYEVDERVALAPMPGWLLTLLAEHQTVIRRVGADPIELVTKGVKAGARNDQLTRMVGLLVGRSELSPEQILALAELGNARCNPPLPKRDLVTIVNSIFRREQRKLFDAANIASV